MLPFISQSPDKKKREHKVFSLLLLPYLIDTDKTIAVHIPFISLTEQLLRRVCRVVIEVCVDVCMSYAGDSVCRVWT